MKDILEYYAKRLAGEAKTLKKKNYLVDVPWCFMEDGQLVTVYFRPDKSAIISINGKATKGEWDYVPSTGALMLNNGKEGYLYSKMYVDKNILIMKRDSLDNAYVAFINKKKLTFDGVENYLSGLYHRDSKAVSANRYVSFYTDNGISIEVIGLKKFESYKELIDRQVRIRQSYKDQNKKLYITLNNRYRIDNNSFTLHVRGGRILSVYRNHLLYDIEGELFIVEMQFDQHKPKVLDYVSHNGDKAEQSVVKSENGAVYFLERGKIRKIVESKEVVLENGFHLHIQKTTNKRNYVGCKIWKVEPVDSIDNGKYPIHEDFGRIRVVDGEIVSRKEYRLYKRSLR